MHVSVQVPGDCNRDNTVNMLNCFKDYKKCLHISYHILDFVQQKKIQFTIEQPYMLPMLYCQYHACWYRGDLRRKGISRNWIGQIIQNIRSLSIKRVNVWSQMRWGSRPGRPTVILHHFCNHQVMGSRTPNLTYWHRDKMIAILHKTFSNVLSWMKIFAFWLSQTSLKFIHK